MVEPIRHAEPAAQHPRPDFFSYMDFANVMSSHKRLASFRKFDILSMSHLLKLHAEISDIEDRLIALKKSTVSVPMASVEADRLVDASLEKLQVYCKCRAVCICER